MKSTLVKLTATLHPNIPFETRDIEDSSVAQLGPFDLVLCFGLLYHLESPLRAIRHLRKLTGKVLLLESMCIPSELNRLSYCVRSPTVMTRASPIWHFLSKAKNAS